MARNRFEVAEELEALNTLAEDSPAEMQDAIHTQVSVIELGLTCEQIRSNYDEDPELLEAGLTAERWLYHDDESPSETWQEQVEVA